MILKYALAYFEGSGRARNFIKRSVFILLVVSSLYSFGQNVTTDSSTTVVGYWQKGDVANFTLTQTKEQYDNKRLLMRGSSVSQIEIKVLFANTNSYILNWKYRDINVNGIDSQEEAEKEFATLIKGINFIYKTSEHGEFQELINWAEVQAAVIKIIDKLIAKTKNPNLQPALNQARTVFSSKENIELLIMKDIQLYHSIYGGEYLLNQKMSAETSLPNILGGNPFPAIVELELYELDLKKNACKIRVVQTIDEVKAAEEISAMIKKNGQLRGKNPIDIIDKTEYEVELARGWITKYLHSRSSQIGEKRNVETQELKRVN